MRRWSFVRWLALIMVVSIIDAGMQTLKLFNLSKQIHVLQAGLEKSDMLFPGEFSPKITRVKKEKMLEDFIATATINDLMLQQVSTIKDENVPDHESLIEAVFIGNFSQIIQFFQNIFRQCIPSGLDQLEIVQDKGRLRLRVRIKGLGFCVPMTLDSKTFFYKVRDIHDPFSGGLTNEEEIQLNSAQLYSVNQMKFSGFIRYSNQMIAIITLPDGSSKEVRVKEALGSEHAVVVRIEEGGVWVQTHGENKKITTNE